MKYVTHDPVTDQLMLETRDIWKFTPDDYLKKWKLKRFKKVEDIADNFFYTRQVKAMDALGKPFALSDKRPINLNVEDFHRYEKKFGADPKNLTLLKKKYGGQPKSRLQKLQELRKQKYQNGGDTPVFTDYNEYLKYRSENPISS